MGGVSMKSLILWAPLSVMLMLTSVAGAGQPAADKKDAAMDHAGMSGMDHGSMDASGMGSMNMAGGSMNCPMCSKGMSGMSMGSGAVSAAAKAPKAIAPAAYQRPVGGRRCGRC
jgi:uncharacterized protein involved in copper resistance